MSLPILRPVSPFAAATLVPVPLLVLGGPFGGVFILAALLCLTLVSVVLDRLITTAGRDAAPGTEFPAADRLSETLVAAHAVLLPVGIAAVAGATGLGFWEGLAALVAFGLYFGQVSNSNAHELIHRPGRRHRRMGKWVLISLLFGHHVTAHLRIHHRHVGTPDDPNTARLGEGFYAFAARAWAGSFVAGWEIENALARVKGVPLSWWRHPYAEYVGGALVLLALATFAFGASGLIAYLLIALYAQAQLLLSDYVQHYGLRRRRTGDDEWEAVAPWHSWNAPHWFSGGLMLNAPRHSEHHTNPTRPYPELSLPDWREGPRLPGSLPVMGAAALVPPIWRWQMDKRALSWQKRIDEGRITRSPPPELLAARPGLLDWLGGLSRARRGATPGPGTVGPAPAAGRPPQAEDDAVTARVSATLAGPEAPAAAGPAAAPAPPAAAAEAPHASLPATGPGAPPDGLSPQFLRQLGDDEIPEAEHLRARAERERAEAIRAATPDLWASGEAPAPVFAGQDADPDLPDERQVPSSSLFRPQPGEEDPALIAAADPGSGAQFRPGTEPVDLEEAIARTVATERRDQRRRRAAFPDLEQFEERPAPTFRERLRLLGRCAILAAQGVAAVLQGRPAGGGAAD